MKKVIDVDEVIEEIAADDPSLLMRHELPPEIREPRKPSMEDLMKMGLDTQDIFNIGMQSGYKEYDATTLREEIELTKRQHQSAQMIDAGPNIQKSHSAMQAYFSGKDCLRYLDDAPTKGKAARFAGTYKAGDPIPGPDGKPQMCKRAPFVFSPRDGRARNFGINGYIFYVPVNKPVNLPMEVIELIKEVGYATESYELVQNAMIARQFMSIQQKMGQQPGFQAQALSPELENYVRTHQAF